MKKINPELNHLFKTVLIPCDYAITNVEAELESHDYCAHTFKLDEKIVKFRKAKITPTKTGLFVALWKRDVNGITAPHDILDKYDLYIIATQKGTKSGVFIFPKEVLLEHGVLSGESSVGKRGFRIYPTWDLTSSKQAQKTQLWQTKYFLENFDSKSIDVNRANRLIK